MMTKEQILRNVAVHNDCTLDEAGDILQDVQEMFREAVEAADTETVEDIMYEELGLELDFLVEVIDYFKG